MSELYVRSAINKFIKSTLQDISQVPIVEFFSVNH